MKGMSYGIEALLTLGGARFRRVGTIPTAAARARGREPPVADRHPADHAAVTPARARRSSPARATARFVPLVSACVRLLGGPLIDPQRDPRGAVREIRAARAAAAARPDDLPRGPPQHGRRDPAVPEPRASRPSWPPAPAGLPRAQRRSLARAALHDLLFRVHLIDAMSEVIGPYEPPGRPGGAARVRRTAAPRSWSTRLAGAAPPATPRRAA